MVLKVVNYLIVDIFFYLGVKRYLVDIGVFNWYVIYLLYFLK